MTALRSIDGGTQADRAAVEVHKKFSEAYDEAIKETGRMSAFLVIAFDDSGSPTSILHMGEYFPIPPVMLPDIVKQCAVSMVY